jgi:hypothetical protein
MWTESHGKLKQRWALQCLLSRKMFWVHSDASCQIKYCPCRITFLCIWRNGGRNSSIFSITNTTSRHWWFRCFYIHCLPYLAYVTKKYEIGMVHITCDSKVQSQQNICQQMHKTIQQTVWHIEACYNNQWNSGSTTLMRQDIWSVLHLQLQWVTLYKLGETNIRNGHSRKLLEVNFLTSVQIPILSMPIVLELST